MSTYPKRYPTVLTIAGSDSGGGAGIQADLKTFSSLGTFGASVITAITAQNTAEVRAVEVLSPEIVRKQIEAVLDDIAVDAVKTGMLPTAEIIETVACCIDKYNLRRVVVDPVMVATSGARLTSSSIAGAMKKYLYPRIALITPNIPEAEALSGVEIASRADMCKAAEVLLSQGCPAVLIKGGHELSGPQPQASVMFHGQSVGQPQEGQLRSEGQTQQPPEGQLWSDGQAQQPPEGQLWSEGQVRQPPEGQLRPDGQAQQPPEGQLWSEGQTQQPQEGQYGWQFGAHSYRQPSDSTDILFMAGREPVEFTSPRIDSGNLHGTGCTFSAAIAAYMALDNDFDSAIGLAKRYITAAIDAGKDIVTGKGFGPVNHFFDPQKLKTF